MKDKWIQGHLGYDEISERYGLLVSDLWEHHFHCGDYLQVKVGDEWVDTTMEMYREDGEPVWYLTDTGLRGAALEWKEARIPRK